MGGKAADRAAKKQAAKQQVDDEPAQAGAPGRDALVAMAKQLVMDSVLVRHAPQVPKLVTEGVEFHKAAKTGQTTESKPAEKGEEKETEDENEQKGDQNEQKEENDEKPDKEGVSDVNAVFDALVARLKFYNALGLGLPVWGEDALDAWSNLKNLECDGGPRSRKKGNPAMDRILANFYNNAAQYLHVLLVLMVLRAFLFRSFFAFLPWLCGYQVLSLMLPLGLIEDKFKVIHAHVGLRITATLCVHALVWFFFLLEAVYMTHFMEKLLCWCIFICHAYVMRPAQLCPVN